MKLSKYFQIFPKTTIEKINLSHLSHDKYPLILSTSPVLSEAGLGQKNIQFSALLRLPGSANTLRREGSLRTAERPLERSSANKSRAVSSEQWAVGSGQWAGVGAAPRVIPRPGIPHVQRGRGSGTERRPKGKTHIDKDFTVVNQGCRGTDRSCCWNRKGAFDTLSPDPGRPGACATKAESN